MRSSKNGLDRLKKKTWLWWRRDGYCAGIEFPSTNSRLLVPVDLPRSEAGLDTAGPSPAVSALAAHPGSVGRVVCFGDGAPAHGFIYVEGVLDGLVVVQREYAGEEDGIVQGIRRRFVSRRHLKEKKEKISKSAKPAQDSTYLYDC